METQKFTVSKLNASRRQLNTAIELWFEERDEISVHTLAAAAYQVIHDVNESSDTKAELLYNSIVIKDEHRSEAIRFLKRPMNFFKHADNDPHATLEFFPALTDIYLLFAIEGLRSLGEDRNDICQAFLWWILFTKPHLVAKGYQEEFRQRFPLEQLESLRTMPKCDFLKAYLFERVKTRVS
jgi:hypothetical protein